jgi:hypothetical protein
VLGDMALSLSPTAVGNVDLDPVALLDQPDQPALGRFRRDMADRQARGAAREAPVGHSAQALPRPFDFR